MAALPPMTVRALRNIDARFDDVELPFEREHAGAISAHWKNLTAANPHLWNGRVIVQHAWTMEGDIYRARYVAINYASMLYWRDNGFPGPKLRNGFAAAALRSRDGAFVLGVMGQSTANAGKHHMPAGTPDLSDVRDDGSVDLAGSLIREMSEETGLQPSEYVVGNTWYAVEAEPRVAFIKIVDLPLSAEDARALILKRLPTLAEVELIDCVIVRASADIDRQWTPLFFQMFLDQALAGRLPTLA
jgi:8-oxo-dGTP pyrophosphatase MutT (NUDIX family)